MIGKRASSLGIIRTATLLLAGLGALGRPNLAQPVAHIPAVATPGLGDHYLLLVNTAIAFQMDEPKLRQFDKSPYDGIAIAFQHAYDTADVPSVAAMDAQIAQWTKYTKKDIWPWVYINRMVGTKASENNAHSDVPYFHKIQGMDLDDKNGALTDFLKLWSNSLDAARHSNVPGIVFDPEFYNYYKQYDIAEIADNTGKKPQEVAESLKKLGTRMADIAAKEYPTATLWFLVTALTHPGYKTYNGVPYYPSPAYISIGLLDEIAKNHLQLKVLAGGEGSIGYCHENLAAFKSAIDKRQSDIGAQLQKYNGFFSLAGTLTLWSEPSAKQNWVNQDVCKISQAATVEDLEPYLELLMKTYRYNWIYASGDGGYLAFFPEIAPRFDKVIAKAKSQVFDHH
jgi:hypothetical protein